MEKLFVTQFWIKLLLVVTILLSSCSCSLINPQGDSLPLWKVQTFGNALLLVNTQPYIWNGYTLFPSEKNDSTYLTLIENSSGKIRWQWAECFYGKEDLIDEQYANQNTYCLQTTDGVYCINLDNGKTIFKTRISQGGGNSITGIGSTFFNSTKLSVINQGIIQTGSFNEVFSFPQEPDFRVIIDTPVPFIAPNQDTMLVLDIAKLRLRDVQLFSRLALYNLSKRAFVYDSTRVMNESGPMPQINNNRIYQIQGASLVCNDLWTGRELWRHEFGNSFLGYGFSIKDGKIFATNGDSNLYCLDSETGRELWRKTRVAFDTPAPFVMNGVVYVASGVLWAFDANTGEEIWKRTSQDDTGFRGRVNGADGKVYAYTRQNAYCYKAAR